MNSSEAQPSGHKMENNLQQDFTSFHQDYMAALEKSAETVRNAISVAQQSITAHLNQEGPGQPEAQAHIPNGLDNQVQAITVQAVNEAFARAKAVLEQAEHATAEAPVGVYTPQAPLPATEQPTAKVPADPLVATNFLVSQATKSLSSAMDGILKAMRLDTAGPPGE